MSKHDARSVARGTNATRLIETNKDDEEDGLIDDTMQQWIDNMHELYILDNEELKGYYGPED